MRTEKKCCICGGVMHRQAINFLVTNRHRYGVNSMSDEAFREKVWVDLEYASLGLDGNDKAVWMCRNCCNAER